MKSTNSQKISKLLDKHDYRVVVQNTDGGYLVTFPSRKELPVIGFVRLYQEFQPMGILTCFYNEEGIEVDKQETLCPPYSHKLFSLYSVMYYCLSIGYDVSFVKFVLNNKEVSEEALFAPHADSFLDVADSNRERILHNILSSCFNDGFLPKYEELAEQEGVIDGFLAIRRLFVPDNMMDELHAMIELENSTNE